MKKILFGFLAMLVSVTLFAERISPDDAALVANNFMNVASAPGVKKAVPQKKMVRKATAEENLFYVYENESGEGWVIVAADDAVTPVLAYSETGHFRTDNLPVNVRSWMGKYNHFITKIEAEGVVASEETAEEWNTLRKHLRKAKSDAVVGPLIETTWDQDAPYYNLCPGSGNDKAYTGCVATAMAQVMKYWEWPVKGTGSHSYQPLDPNTGKKSSRYTSTLSVNFGETTYDWANMKNSYSGNYGSAQATAVATLMYHCGVATEMMYGNDADGGSGAYTVNYGDWETNAFPCAQNAFHEFFGYKKDGLTGYMRDGYTYTDDYGHSTKYYDKWTDADWTAMIKAELDKQHPIMYGGAGKEGGHSFICDGYDDAGYFHFNWGWSGENDGYYTLSDLAPGSGGAGGGSYSFSEDQDVIIGIVPDKKDLPKVKVTWSVDGVETDVEYTQEDNLVLPENPADCESGKVFVGWTAKNTVDGEKPADLFTTAAGKTVMEATTYYAVYATKEESGAEPAEVAAVAFKTAESDGTTNVSDKIKSKLVNSDSGISSYSGNNVYQGKEGAKIGARNAAGYITLTLANTVAVSKVVVNASKYGNDTGKILVNAGSTSLGEKSPAANLQYVAENPVETNTIMVATTSKRAYVASVSVIAGAGATYSGYTITCPDVHSAVKSTTVEKPCAVKAIREGQVVIIRGGEVYNILGVKE